MTIVKLRPLEKLQIIGKKGGDKPFSVSTQKGLYFYISTEDFDKLAKINERCKSLPSIDVEPLKNIKIVGRGGYPGYRPFTLTNHKGTYLCILEEHFERLKEINSAYCRVLEVEERREEKEKLKLEARKIKSELERKRRETELKKRLEEKRRLEEEQKKKLGIKRKKAKEGLASLESIIEDAKISESIKYVPEIMEEVEKSFKEIKKAVEVAKYDKALKLIPKALELANYIRSEALRKAKLKIPEGKYLYGIIPAPKKEIDFGNIGLGSEGKVYTINYKDLAAVVSDTPLKDYPVTEEYSKAHEGVVGKVLEKHSVVPAAFGQVFKNQKILRVLMKKAHKALKECTKLVDNKVELGVKAVVPKQVVESLDEKKKKALVESGEEIFNTLNKKAVESVKGRLFSDRLILNASFLVDKNKVKKFSEEVGKISEKYKNSKLRYSGPWAPYSFVCIKVGARGIEVGRSEVK